MMHVPTVAIVIAAAALAAGPAAAANFTGTASNLSLVPSTGAPCAPLRNVVVTPSETSGSSNQGNFTYAQTHCTTGGPGAYGGGNFTFTFGNGTLTGDYTGVASPSGTMGLLNNSIAYVVTGGSGRFAATSGTFNGIGTLDFRVGGGRVLQQLDLSGSLTAVPEPAVWASLILGLGWVGGSLRLRRRQALVNAPA